MAYGKKGKRMSPTTRTGIIGTALIIMVLTVLATQNASGQQPGDNKIMPFWLGMERIYDCARIETKDKSETAQTAVRELLNYWRGRAVTLKKDNKMPDNGGFVIIRPRKGGRTIIKARRSIGLLYGAYELLRQQAVCGIYATKTPIFKSYIPVFHYRIFNPTLPDGDKSAYGSTGLPLLNWSDINGKMGTMGIDQKERLTTFARANAAIGINGTVINAPNTKSNLLTNEYIDKIKVIADLLQPYGITAYIKVDIDSPSLIGGLGANRPPDKSIKEWWKKKAKDIYKKIPHLGGFFVTVDTSEPNEGNNDIQTLSSSINILAEALAPYKGFVIWYTGKNISSRNKTLAENVILHDADRRHIQSRQESNGTCRRISNFPQTYWYAFGRLTWNPELSSDSVTNELSKQAHLRCMGSSGIMTKTVTAVLKACADDIKRTISKWNTMKFNDTGERKK